MPRYGFTGSLPATDSSKVIASLAELKALTVAVGEQVQALVEQIGAEPVEPTVEPEPVEPEPEPEVVT